MAWAEGSRGRLRIPPAPEGRRVMSHRRPPAIGAEILPPLAGLGIAQGAELRPRLAPRAIFCRRSAALVGLTRVS